MMHNMPLFDWQRLLKALEWQRVLCAKPEHKDVQFLVAQGLATTDWLERYGDLKVIIYITDYGRTVARRLAWK